MNPAALLAPKAQHADSYPRYTHYQHVARSSLGETTTTRAYSLVVNLSIDSD